MVVLVLASACHWIYRASVTSKRVLLCRRLSCVPLLRQPLQPLLLVCYKTLALVPSRLESSARHSLAALRLSLLKGRVSRQDVRHRAFCRWEACAHELSARVTL